MDIKTNNIDNIKALMANVLDGHNGENLYSYLSRFNHLNVGYVASAISARESVPAIMRKNGLIITYYINENPTTEQYVGDKNTAGTDAWTDDSNWQFIDGIGQVDTNSITLNQLSQEVLDLIGKNKKINIVNYPDGEDLTQIDVCGGNSKNEVNVLKFADKKYNPANFSGLGRVYLRKNIVEVEQEDGSIVHKNILTQDMINKENTEYIIQYDYDLNGERITIPEGCILKFENGSFSNGTILGNKTDLINPNFNNIECKNIKENNNIDKIIYDTNGQAYPAFPKLNKGQYIITAYGDNSNVGQVTINGYSEDNSIIYSFTIKYSSDGYTQLIDIADYPDNIYRFAVLSANKYIFKIDKYINNAKVLKVYDTFNDMNNDDTLSYGDICYIKGYYKKYDDGDSFWCIENISSRYDTHAIINVIGGETAATKNYIKAINIVLQNGLRAILICKDRKINVLKIGLKNNGEDCTEQLKNIIPKLAQGDCLYFPGGRYYFTDTIDFGKNNIFIEGETNINIGDNSYTANSSPYWQSDFNNSIVQSKDNGNSITIFRFNFGTNTDKTCIRSNVSSYISNVVITNNSFDFEGTYGGTNLNPPDNPLTGVIKYENINALDGFTNITNCGFSGFSGKAINNINYGYINNVRFYKCNIGIYAGIDCMITNIRASSCNTIMYNFHLNQINNVRGDSIAGYVFVVRGSGCIYDNIEIDYCKKSCFNLAERGDYCTIKSNCLRVQTNSWNNNIDNEGTVKLDECFIHVETPVRGLNIEINLLDAHATDAGNHPDYNKYIIYPCILGVENNINHLNAIIHYGGSYNDADKQDITINRLLQLKSDCYINGKIICNNEIYLFNNYSLGSIYYKNYIYYGTTDNRPDNLTEIDTGFQYFDTTLNKPIWWNGTEWVEGSTGGSGTNLDGAEVTDVETLEPTEQAEAAVTIIDNKVKFTFAIPRGRDGQDGQNGQDGAPGKDGVSPTLPNYSIYRYCKSDSKPTAPTGTSQNPSGWVDIPNDTGNWWQCIGQINGATGTVIQWGEVLPLNGRDGTAQDVNTNRGQYPTIDRSVRTPSGWTLAAPSVNQGQYLWMTTAIINPNDTLYTNWNIPVCISGPQGDTGATGPAGNPGSPGSQGATGIPGVSMLAKYSLGDADNPGSIRDAEDFWSDSESHRVENSEKLGMWKDTVPEFNSTTDILYCTQGKKIYTDNSNYYIEWCKPFQLSGVNGIDGSDGKGSKGQIIYPAGIYNLNATYITTDKVAPYVLDTTDSNYYVLNAIMSWKGTEHDNLTPSQDYAINHGKYWLKFDGFNAVYAKIGIIANGLIGSAVFNGDWMFSQQGINQSGSLSTEYQLFNPNSPYSSDNQFRPNIAINFKTGEVYMARGNFYCDANGNVTIKGISAQGGVFTNSTENVTLPEVPDNTSVVLRYTFANITRLEVTKHITLGNSLDKIIQSKYDSSKKVNYAKVDTSDTNLTLPYGYGYVEFIGIRANNQTIWYVTIFNFGMELGATNNINPAYVLTPYINDTYVVTANT